MTFHPSSNDIDERWHRSTEEQNASNVETIGNQSIVYHINNQSDTVQPYGMNIWHGERWRLWDELATKAKRCRFSSGNIRTYDTVINLYIVGIVSVVGILANVLSIVVLGRDKEKPKTTRFLLQTLAVVDAFFLAMVIITNPADLIFNLTSEYPAVIPYAYSVSYIAETSAVWMVLLVTVDRYLAVCFPWKVEWKEPRRAKIAVAVVLVSAVVYSIPAFIDSIRESYAYILVYHTVCYAIFRAVCPLATLLVLNGYLIKEVHAMRQRHLDLTNREAHPDNVTLMLVVVVTVFLICQLPTVALRIAFTIASEALSCSPSRETFYILVFLTGVLLVINSSVNFIIYCVVGSRFRAILVRTLRCDAYKSQSIRNTESENIS